jgi:histidine ammonia-lyase
MGWGGGRKLLTIIENVRRVLAVEILCATRAIECRAPLQPGAGTSRLVSAVRDLVPPLEGDRSPSSEIELVAGLIEQGAIAGLV